jgi:hypothetical protein
MRAGAFKLAAVFSPGDEVVRVAHQKPRAPLVLFDTPACEGVITRRAVFA